MRKQTHSLSKETGSSGHLGQVKKSDELAGVLLSLSILHDRHSQRTQQHEPSQLLHLLIILPLLNVHHVPSPSSRVENSHAPSLCLEDPRQLLVIVGHHGRARRSLAGWVGEQTLDVLDGSEGLLPELEVDGGV